MNYREEQVPSELLGISLKQGFKEKKITNKNLGLYLKEYIYFLIILLIIMALLMCDLVFSPKKTRAIR